MAATLSSFVTAVLAALKFASAISVACFATLVMLS